MLLTKRSDWEKNQNIMKFSCNCFLQEVGSAVCLCQGKHWCIRHAYPIKNSRKKSRLKSHPRASLGNASLSVVLSVLSTLFHQMSNWFDSKSSYHSSLLTLHVFLALGGPETAPIVSSILKSFWNSDAKAVESFTMHTTDTQSECFMTNFECILSFSWQFNIMSSTYWK